eukprot:CAMPEP_0206439296 /NCGR_PEP_ID=MMETSP0324_2-20121206/12126_1 /ASSEMBLY_ACC=CAM_ASM_000836 /TAXON_ID=2866 /ORGANISM="Crypthecodinium cohnii, Strain Seligo" /LENGTH=271 /DNA_ID=CAMNT_0053906889 /DNA_START=80 /DNA_END=891 /DNA_ORIENTATION=+
MALRARAPALLSATLGLGRSTFPPAAPSALIFQRSFTAWGMHGMYGARGSPDPTDGRARWHRLDNRKEKETQEKKILGKINSKEYDEQHGRWWFTLKEEERPKLYTSIGRHARSKKLKRTIVRFAYSSKNFKRLRRDPYRKRWPKMNQIGAKFFAEFCNKEYAKRTMLETAHTLPLYGVGCKLFRHQDPTGQDTRGKYFIVESSEYTTRPIRGTVKGTQYMNGKPIRSDIAAVAKSLGSWRYELPADGHPAIYRPVFPKSVAASKAEAAAA